MYRRIGPAPGSLRPLLVGFYSWLVVALFGAVLLDGIYAKAIRGALGPAEAAALFSTASDFFLLVVALAGIAAVAAIGSAWESRLARNLLIASGLLVLGELFVPLVLRPFPLEPATGRWIRLGLSASASVLGLLALAASTAGRPSSVRSSGLAADY